jgi:dihydrofolate reductase
VRTLIEHDLVDELRLMVYPVVLGACERIFGETSGKSSLRLVNMGSVGDGLAYSATSSSETPSRRRAPPAL